MSDDTPLYILDNHPLFKTIHVLYDLGFAHTRLLFNPQIDGKMTVDTVSINIGFDEIKKEQGYIL